MSPRTAGDLTLDWQMYLRPDNPDSGLLFFTPAPNANTAQALIGLASSSDANVDRHPDSI